MKDEMGFTPLMLGCNSFGKSGGQKGEKFLSVLLDAKVNVDMKNDSGAQALHYAASSNVPPGIVERLINKTTVNEVTSVGSPLHWAVSENTPNAVNSVRVLIEKGADVNRKRSDGISPVVIAAASQSDESASLIIKAGCDVGVLLGGGITIMHIAADNNLLKTLESLCQTEAGAKLREVKNDNGETPIMLAAGHDYVDAVRILMDGGPGSNSEEKAKDHMVEILKSAPAKTLPPSADGKSKKDGEKKAPEASSEPENEKDKALFDEIAKILEEEDKNPTSEEDKAKAEELKKEGNAFFKAKEYRKAIASYTSAIDAFPVDKTYYSNRSACFMAVNEPISALRDAVFCRCCDKEWSKACYRLAVARMALDRYEDAALAAWEGVQLDEGNKELKTIMQRAVEEGRKVHHQKK